MTMLDPKKAADIFEGKWAELERDSLHMSEYHCCLQAFLCGVMACYSLNDSGAMDYKESLMSAILNHPGYDPQTTTAA